MNIQETRVISNVYYHYIAGTIQPTFSLSSVNIRPSIALNKEVTILGGTGTSENPYIIK